MINKFITLNLQKLFVGVFASGIVLVMSACDSKPLSGGHTDAGKDDVNSRVNDSVNDKAKGYIAQAEPGASVAESPTIAPQAAGSIEPPIENPRYKKIDQQGNSLSYEAAGFSCVTDVDTHLMWQVKPSANQSTYRWGGKGAQQVGDIFYPDWDVLLAEVNEERLCGYSDWRLPTIDELKSLVAEGEGDVRINHHYFPGTVSGIYWSSSAYDYYQEHAQTVNFADGVSAYYNGFRGERAQVRLVRNAGKVDGEVGD